MHNIAIDISKEISAGYRGFSVKTAKTGRERVSITITIPVRGHVPRFVDRGQLVLASVGHLYARSANSFDVEKSLSLLADVYLESGIEETRKAIGGGMFALFVLDRARGRLYVTGDFLSCLPIYYRSIPDGFLLGINQFDLSDGIMPGIGACAEYLAYGYLPFHGSLFPETSRLAPGQLLSLDLANPSAASVTGETLPTYPALGERIGDENEAVDRMDALFSAYFSRLGDERLAAGLSGGYDSRLIAAYCRDKPISFVTFDNPHTNEARNARAVAATLGSQTRIFGIPDDAPSRYADDFVYGASTSDSLESGHMFANLAVLMDSGPEYLIDGHIGDVIFGGGWYYKLKDRTEPLGRILLGLDEYLDPPQGDEAYLRRLKTGYGRRIGGLGGNLDSIVDTESDARLREMIATVRPHCETDADISELLLHRFRGAPLTSGGPVSFMRRAPTLSPFYDAGIFEACMGLSKKLRAGDRVYNAFYRRRFPELARLPKENTGGNATQSVSAYRLTHLATSGSRKLVSLLPRWMKSGGAAGGNLDGFQRNYLANGDNLSFFGEVNRRNRDRLADIGIPPATETEITDAPILALRRVSLGLLLEGRP